MADNGRLDNLEDAVRALVQGQAEDRERWAEYQRSSLQMMGLLVGLGKEVGDHGRILARHGELLDRIAQRLDRHDEILDRHDAMLDRIDGSLDATLKALHRLLEGR